MWDYDEVGTHILIDGNIAGQARKLITHSARNGFLYTFDRFNGQSVLAKPYTENITNFTTNRPPWRNLGCCPRRAMGMRNASRSVAPQAAGGALRQAQGRRRPPPARLQVGHLTDCPSTLPHEAGCWHVSGRSEAGPAAQIDPPTRGFVGYKGPREGTEERRDGPLHTGIG